MNCSKKELEKAMVDYQHFNGLIDLKVKPDPVQSSELSFKYSNKLLFRRYGKQNFNEIVPYNRPYLCLDSDIDRHHLNPSANHANQVSLITQPPSSIPSTE